MNSNCLEGMRCPKCGSEEPFFIEVRTQMLMWDEGSDYHTDLDHDDASFCRCYNCDREGTVADFKIKEENDDYGEAQCPECGGMDVKEVMVPDNVGKGMHEGFWCYDCNEEVHPEED